MVQALLKSPFTRYLVPFAAFIGIGALQTAAPSHDACWLIYGVKMLVTGALLWWFFRPRKEEIPGGFDWNAVFTGLAVLAVWIIYYTLAPASGEDALGLVQVPLFAVVLFKLIGSTTVVPVLEELIFRSFLMRILIKDDFLSVPAGAYKPHAFWISAVLFALMHPMNLWGVALFAGVAYGAYFVKTKNLWGAVIAHAVTNLGLWLYVLILGKWALWS